MPRPDISSLGSSYRRIPLLTIGRDIYLDTRLILSKLEQLFPPSAQHPALSSGSLEHKATEKLLEHWAIDNGLFNHAAALIPSDIPLLKDPKFQKDREDYTGRSWSKASVEKGRPEALVEIRNAFEFLEGTVLADGREWVLGGGEGPALADIEGM
jgi:glutathione S-transferase